MPKIVDKERMKQMIIQASIKTFLNHGFKNTTMELIAKNAKIAKGTLYLYFKSKQSLIDDITKQHYDLLKQFLTAEELFETLDDLLIHVKNNLLINKEEAEFIKIFFDAFGAQLSNKEFTDQYSNFFEEVALFYKKNFELLIRNKEIDEGVNATTLSRIFVSMLDGIILHKGFFKIPDDKHLLMVEESIKMFRLGLVCSKRAL
jgi:AcrR family transcriptional regulator